SILEVVVCFVAVTIKSIFISFGYSELESTLQLENVKREAHTSSTMFIIFFIKLKFKFLFGLIFI
ncbi:MAG: hypothetical protein ACJAXF_002651, partial [Polaribacter sp.]